ncbi:LptF/LptG family permease [Flavobacterium sp. SUN046]|nr:LptF/LptG family permease [Flavobacterium sp. SUN046]MEC4048520.1 LptF/LptG family permease [Flavobacterium sp. SUN046]
MKIIDKYLLKSFLITFTTVFVILFFIFILQTVWLFISELAGRGLDFMMILKFLLFATPRLIPLVLPLSVLLASIMTFGSLSENYEFAAMKSSGISLQRALRSLTVFIVLLSIVSFIFANNVIPYAEYKFINFRRNIAQSTPAMAIAEGQFSKIGNYTIKVDKKSGENGNFLTGVTIHKKLDNGQGNVTVIKAQKGELLSNSNSNVLKLVLTDGYYYEDVIPKRYEERNKIPFAKATFKKDVINIDLSKLNKTEGDDADISNTNAMLNISELKFTLDSLNKNYKKDLSSYTENIYQRSGMTQFFSSVATPKYNYKNLLEGLDKEKKLAVYNIAASNIQNTCFSIDGSLIEIDAKEKNINGHWIAIYDKFMIAYACLLMFFIGAPLGAIIRKGGLGLPIVFAVSIFIIFHFINTFGKRVAQENGMSPFLGTWMSSMILTPLAILLTYRATNDIGLINFDAIADFFSKIFNIMESDADMQQPIINLDSYQYEKDEDWKLLNTYEDSQLIQIVKNAKQYNYSYDYRTKALIVLDARGITQEELLENNNLYNLDYLEIEHNYSMYQKYAKVAFILNFVAIILSMVVQNNRSLKPIIIITTLIMIGFYYMIYNSQKKVDKIGTYIGRTIEPGIMVALVLGFPFYFLIYWYNNKTLKEAIAEYR